jgi:hypothetical protein
VGGRRLGGCCEEGKGKGKLTGGQGIELVLGDVDGRLGLAPQGNNGLAGVTADDGNGSLAGVGLAGDLSNKGLCADNVEGGDTEKLLGVELAGGLEDLGGDGDSAVDGVGDDEDKGVGAVFGNTLHEVSDDAGVDLEQVVTGHARLACWWLVSTEASSCVAATYGEYQRE